MTEIANIIRAIEHATTPAAKKAEQAAHPTDSVFRDFLRWTLDPFKQYGFSEEPWEPEEIVDPAAVNAAVAQEWERWEEVLEGLSKGHKEPVSVERWKDSPAWPIYQRCLLKRIHGLSVATANSFRNAVGSSTFKVARIATDEVATYPAFVEPVFKGPRRLVVIHRPYEAANAKVDAFNLHGVCRNLGFPKRICQSLASFKWELWLNEDKDFSHGVVLDGVVRSVDDTKMFQVGDVLSLSKFRKQHESETYRARRSRLDALATMLQPGVDSFYPAPAHSCGDAELLQEMVKTYARDVKRGILKGVAAKLPQLSYPYKMSQAWVWVSRAD